MTCWMILSRWVCMLAGMTSALKAEVKPKMYVFLSYTFVKVDEKVSFSSYSKKAERIP